MHRLKIVAIVPHISGNLGSAVNERGFLVHLTREGYDIIAFSFDGAFPRISRLREVNGSIIILHFPNLYFIWVYSHIVFSILVTPLLLLILKLLDVKLVYIRGSPLAALPASILPRNMKKRLVVKIPSIAEMETRGFTSKLIVLMDEIITRIPEIILAFPTEEFRRIWCELRGSKSLKRKYIILPAGVEDTVISDRGYRGERERVTLGFIGSVSKRKKADILIPLMEKLVEIGFKPKLLVIGTGPLLTLLREKCLNKGLDCVFTGEVSHERAINYLKEVDILLLLYGENISRQPVLSKSAMEAWCLGIPVISNLEIICSVGGALCTGSDLDSVLSSVLEAMISREHIISNYRYLCDSFRYSKIVKGFLSEFDSLMKRFEEP